MQDGDEGMDRRRWAVLSGCLPMKGSAGPLSGFGKLEVKILLAQQTVTFVFSQCIKTWPSWGLG